MSSTINFVGIGGNEKPSSRVLRQPGGGSSILFGDEQAQTPRSVKKNHMESNIFSTEKNGDLPRRTVQNTDSYKNLFGEIKTQQPTPSKNYMKSNILNTGNGHRDHLRDRNGSVSSASSSVSSSSENLKISGVSKTDGKPAKDNKDSSVNGMNGNGTRTRVPPGGYSSGLW